MDAVNPPMPSSLARGAELLADQWWPTTVEAVAQGTVYALLAVACTRRARVADPTQPAAFAVGLLAAYLAYLALGYRPGPTPDVGAPALLGHLALGLLAAVAVATALSFAVGWSFPLGLSTLVVVLAGSWLLLGDDPEPPLRLFRPHELLPGVDDVQLTVVVLAAAALAVALRDGVRPFAASGLLTGTAAFLYLLKVPGSAWYLTAVLVGAYAVTAAVLARTTRGTVVAALALGLVQVVVETAVGPRWWLPFALGLIAAALAVRWLRERLAARKPVAAAPA